MLGTFKISAHLSPVNSPLQLISGVRILFMSAGAWLTVGAFGIQCFIWIITDDALEDWTERSAFGKNTKSRFGSPQSQKQGLEQALVEVGLAA